MTVHLTDLGWDADLAAEAAPFRKAGLYAGRISHTAHGVCTVLTGTGVTRASSGGGMLRLAARDARMLPCAGDWAVLRRWGDGNVTVEAVLRRRNHLVLPDASGWSTRSGERPLMVANFDVAAAVVPVCPEPDRARTGELVDLAVGSGARPLIVLVSTEPVPADLVAGLAVDFPRVGVRTVLLAGDPVTGVPPRPGRSAGPASVVAAGEGGPASVPAEVEGGPMRRLPELVAGRTVAMLGDHPRVTAALIRTLAGAPVLVAADEFPHRPPRRSALGPRRIARAARSGHPVPGRAVGPAAGAGTAGHLVPLPAGGVVLDASVPDEAVARPGDPLWLARGGRGGGHVPPTVIFR